MQHINEKVNQFKQEDGNLYAIYGTPAESLCGLQVEQFRRPVRHCGRRFRPAVCLQHLPLPCNRGSSPRSKSRISEARFWDLSNGGKIQYVQAILSAITSEAIRSLVRRAMKQGLYEGVNLSLAYCDDCGYQQLAMDVCPKCGSQNLTKIDRMNGYLSYSRVQGRQPPERRKDGRNCGKKEYVT